MLVPNFEYMAMVSDNEYVFLLREPPKWKVVNWNAETGHTSSKACMTDASNLHRMSDGFPRMSKQEWVVEPVGNI